MWLLTSPLSLIALAAIPVLVGIYLFRTRSRRYVVSSLFLWIDQQQSRQGGRQISKLQTPLLFFLELLALALLAFAAAGPIMRGENGTSREPSNFSCPKITPNFMLSQNANQYFDEKTVGFVTKKQRFHSNLTNTKEQ